VHLDVTIEDGAIGQAFGAVERPAHIDPHVPPSRPGEGGRYQKNERQKDGRFPSG
jgi:hypothetical protein